MDTLQGQYAARLSNATIPIILFDISIQRNMKQILAGSCIGPGNGDTGLTIRRSFEGGHMIMMGRAIQLAVLQEGATKRTAKDERMSVLQSK